MRDRMIPVRRRASPRRGASPSTFGRGQHCTRLPRFLPLGLLLTLAWAALPANPLGIPGDSRAHAQQGGSAYTPGAGQFDRVIILGIDGADPLLLTRWMDEGRLPNFDRLRKMGDFKPLGTSTPPQSPVAWSNFITGADSGIHGIFDFIHRDPQTYLPYSALSVVTPPEEKVSVLGIQMGNRLPLPFSDYVMPLNGGKTDNLRKGVPFWDVLSEHGVRAVINRVPVNFPPTASGAITLSGMGTPDIQGTLGTYAYYTTNPPPDWEEATGGKIFLVDVLDGVVKGKLYGPPNDFIDYDRIKQRTGRAVPYQEQKASIPFEAYVDEENPVAKVVIDGQEILLEEGRFSPWVHLSFTMLPTPSFVQWVWPALVTVTGTVQFYLKSAHPDFGLYVTAIQIDPTDPALPISTPPEYAAELAKAIGPYYTKGLPEDTKALDKDVFGNADFLKQAEVIFDEETRMTEYELQRFQEGVLFLYYTPVDQCGHGLWRTMAGEEDHPAYVAALDEPFKDAYPQIYERLDRLVGRAMEFVDDRTLLIVMSDHGFATWRRGFHLNRWLYENGYLAVKSGVDIESVEYLQGIDWHNTSLYGIGINGLYVNQMGRERYGTVPPGPARRALLEEVAGKLEGLIDPKTGQHPILKVHLCEDIYSGPQVSTGPDAQMGYERGYRVTDESAVGELKGEVLSDNLRRWSGDHCADPSKLPGVILTNVPIVKTDPALIDLAPTLLEVFGIEPLEHMTGSSIFTESPHAEKIESAR